MNLCINLFLFYFIDIEKERVWHFSPMSNDWSFMECNVQHVSTEIFRWLKPWNYEKQLLMWRLYMLFMSLILIPTIQYLWKYCPIIWQVITYTIKVHVHLHEIFTLRGSLDFFQVIMNSSSLAKSFRSTLLPIYS